MKKLHKLLNWLSQNKIRFEIDQINDEGELKIITNKLTFITYNSEHEVMLINEDGITSEFKINELIIMYW